LLPDFLSSCSFLSKTVTYYARTGPAADVFALHREGEVIIVGLGAGTLAAYARPLEPWTFIDIDPALVEVARNPKLFTFLSDAFPRGDARPAGLLVIDAFSGNAIPTHLLTVEAGKLYPEKTELVALHVSNRHANLTPVVARLARDLRWLAAERDDVVMTDGRASRGLGGADRRHRRREGRVDG
jgi:hypothetical protein